MRCKNCNVDLGEEYGHCPLCGSEAVNDAPIIQGLRTSEYPDVVYKPYPRRVVLILFLIYAGICAAWMAAEYFINGAFGYSVPAVFVIPTVWALFVRPFVVKKEYIGSYLLHDVFFLSLLMLYISKTETAHFYSAIRMGIPLLCITSVVALLIVALLDKYNRVACVSYVLSAIAVNILILIVGIFSPNISVMWSLIAIGTGLITLLIVKALTSKGFNEEIKARFNA